MDFKSCLTLATNEKFVKSTAEKNVKKVWFLDLIKEDHKLLWISILLGLFVAVLGLAMSLFSQKLIDDILPSKNLTKLVSGIALLTVLLLARVGIAILREFFLIQQSTDFNNRINNQFLPIYCAYPNRFLTLEK